MNAGSRGVARATLYGVVMLAFFSTLTPAMALATGYGGDGFGGIFDLRGPGAAYTRQGSIGPTATGLEATGLQDGWKFSSGFSVSAIYTDNADLTNGPGTEQEELFLEVQPYFALTGGSKRIQATGYYAPSLFVGTIGGTPAGVSHDMSLGLNSTAELIEGGGFYLDGYAKASTVNPDPLGPGAGLGYDNYRYNSDNLSQVFTVGVSPYTRHHLGSFADLTTRLTMGLFSFGGASENDALDGGFSASLTSGDDFRRLPWRISYNFARYKYRDESEVDNGASTYSSIVGAASYVISPIWRINGSLGYDNNDYKTSGGETSGINWSLGGTWTPNPRVALTLGYGGQYYGDNWFLDYRYSHKRIGWFASYSTQLTTYQREYLRSQTFLLTTPGGLPVVDPATGRPIQVTQVTPTLSNETYVLSTFITGIGWTGNRTSAGLDLTRNQRDYQATGGTQSDWGIGARISRTLSPDVNISVRISWTNYEETGSDVLANNSSTDTWQGGVAVTKRVGAKSSISGTYDYTNGLYYDYDGPSNSANVVGLTFSHAF
jgi:uncharacterized protein (PEP-CTERM system associated)